jgi:hypothetical protein
MSGFRHRINVPASLIPLAAALTLAACCGSCAKRTDDGADPNVKTRGSVEVTAKLQEIRGEFPPNNLYDYAYILKYQVLDTHRGKVEGATILVGHYNPLKPRAEAADARVKEIGGNLKRFQAGEIHRMALETPIDDHYMGPIINKYHGEEKGPIYWAVWTNRVVR